MLTWHSLCIYTVHYRDCTGPLKRSAALQCYPMPSVSWTMETIPGERTKQKHWKTEQKTCTSEATSQRSKENRETHLIRQQHAFIYSVKNSVEKQQFIKREWVVSNAHLRLRDGGKKRFIPLILIRVWIAVCFKTCIVPFMTHWWPQPLQLCPSQSPRVEDQRRWVRGGR